MLGSSVETNSSELTVDSDSSSFSETVTEKTLQGATVTASFTPGQLDSLVKALKAMPASSTTATVYVQDPKLRAQLAIFIDSLGRMTFRCQAMDQQYFERHIKELSHREKLTAQVTSLMKENFELRKEKEVITQKKSFGEIVTGTLRRFAVYLMLGIIVLGVIVWLSREARSGLKNFITKRFGHGK